MRGRYVVERAVLSAAASLLPRLPLRGVRSLARGLGRLAYYLDIRGRRTGMENLRVAFPQRSVTERRTILRGSYASFARTFMELFWGQRLRADQIDAHFLLDCTDPVSHSVCMGGHGIVVTAHFGNFEWLSTSRGLTGARTRIIAQKFKNPPLTELFSRLRGCHGAHEVIPQEGAMLQLFKHLRRGGSVAALVDLNVRPDQSATIINVFGLRSSVSVLHCALAARTGAPIVPLLAIPEPDGRWRTKYFPPVYVGKDEPLELAAQRCWDVLAPALAEHPECWLWMYKHWRYLPADAEPTSYPAYANRSKKFDTLSRQLAKKRAKRSC